MRDGVVLRAEVWRPRPDPSGPAQGEKFPTLVYRTPYGARRATKTYSIFAKAVARGYAVVIQDVRGRYASAGEFLPYQQEARDGYDTIEWAAAQPWSDGNVGTFGLSYPGAAQWLAAMERPPHLRAMVPAMTFSSARNFFYSGGVFDLSWIGWIWNNIAPDVRVRKNLPGPRTADEARAQFRELGTAFQRKLPLNSLAELKPVAPWYFEWLRHEPYDPWWDWAELRGKYHRLGDVAVLNFSGWHDEAYGPEGAVTNFLGLRAARSTQPDAKTRLILGPWSHGVPDADSCKVGLRDFCPWANIDYDALVLDWMDRHVRNLDLCRGRSLDRPSVSSTFRPLCGAPIHYFVMGANEWRASDLWPLPNAQTTAFYLAPGDGPLDRGKLLPHPVEIQTASTSFVSDPARPVTDPHPLYSGANDYSDLAYFSDVLVFETPHFEQDTEITGPITAEIYLETDAPDTDLWVRLLDVAPDGTAYNLMSPGLDVIRLSYRNAAAAHHAASPAAQLTKSDVACSDASLKASNCHPVYPEATQGAEGSGPREGSSLSSSASGRPTRRELLTPGTVYKVVLPNLMTSNLFRRWHRVRVQISASFFPAFSRNLHTGRLESDSAALRNATLRIHHDREHPSRLLLPLIPASTLP
jgi:hypothetical protein